MEREDLTANFFQQDSAVNIHLCSCNYYLLFQFREPLENEALSWKFFKI